MKIAEYYRLKQPKPTFPIKQVTPGLVNPKLIIGVEIETEGCNLSKEEYGDLLGPIGFNVVTDGSLRGNAFEFISLPMESQTALSCIREFYNLTKFAQDNYTDRCSVHVHVNCTDLEKEQVLGVALLYSVFEQILFNFVGGYRDTNLYCIPWSHCRNHVDLVYNTMVDHDSTLRRWNKYTALNLLPLRTLGTMEFRHMHGTNDMNKLKTWINLIGAMFKYATQTPLKDIEEQVLQLNTISNYEQFFMAVFDGTLPYLDEYVISMEEGVICTKLALINRKKVDEISKERDGMAALREVFKAGIEQCKELRAGGIDPSREYISTILPPAWGRNSIVDLIYSSIKGKLVVDVEALMAWFDNQVIIMRGV